MEFYQTSPHSANGPSSQGVRFERVSAIISKFCESSSAFVARDNRKVFCHQVLPQAHHMYAPKPYYYESQQGLLMKFVIKAFLLEFYNFYVCDRVIQNYIHQQFEDPETTVFRGNKVDRAGGIAAGAV